MLTPRRLLGALLLAVVTTAAILPCAPLALAEVADAGEITMRAKCPCSCSGGDAPSTAVTHLDAGLRPDDLASGLALVFATLEPVDASTLDAPPLARDRIPI